MCRCFLQDCRVVTGSGGIPQVPARGAGVLSFATAVGMVFPVDFVGVLQVIVLIELFFILERRDCRNRIRTASCCILFMGYGSICCQYPD